MYLKAISDPLASCRKEFDYRMQYSVIFAEFFWILQSVAYPFWHAAKRYLISFRAEQKGASNPFKKCNISVCMCLLHETILYLQESF
jgi:hypothetical protein